jgi:hypothetical protein
VAKLGARLRGWRKTKSDEDASKMLYVPNETKGYTITANITTTSKTAFLKL